MIPGADLEGQDIATIQAWGQERSAVREIWLFGSRARGAARPESDVDLALVLTPADDAGNWAFGAYLSQGDAWQRDLAVRLGRPVSLEVIRSGRELVETTKGAPCVLVSSRLDPGAVGRWCRAGDPVGEAAP